MADIILGIPDFETLRANGIIYVDKTQLIYDIVRKPGYYFFSRPRRFGKTLLLSTIEKVFEGREDLFDGLSIKKTNYIWEKRAVLKLGLAGLSTATPDLFEKELNLRLNEIAKDHGIIIGPEYLIPGSTFASLVNELYRRWGKQIVLLIDEYDRPVVDQFGHSELAEQIETKLARFYGVIKILGEQLYFTFITGVTPYAKTSIFSHLNNLNDISFDKKYATLDCCRQEEVDTHFADPLR